MHQHRNISLSSIGSYGLAAMGVACALGMTSCKDKGAEQWNKAEAPAEQAVAAPESTAEAVAGPQSAASAEQKELLNYMIFNIGKLAGEQANSAVWHDQVRDMRNKLEEYYDELEARGNDPQMSMNLGLLLADITRTMKSYDKALKLYNDVLAKWDSQPEATRQTLENRRMRSSIANGMGSCYLLQKKATEALPYYEKALEIDEAIFNELAPKNNEPLPAGNVQIDPDLERAAEDILSSYRCLGDCQLWADDPEEARDTYKKGQELAVRMNNLRPGASVQFIRLRSAQGDLENSCGQLKNAYAAWVHAGQLAQRLLQMRPSPAIQAQVAQALRKLDASLKAISPKVREELEAARSTEAEDEPVPASQESAE